MDSPVITVENLSKRYLLGQRRSKDDGLRHLLNDAIKAPMELLRRVRNPKSEDANEFMALNNVSFSVKQGDIVGVIGRNGAGKSTLLKILSRITEPTSGRIAIYGRVASLLEVGTGFHPELSGRENIFLNGAILGMSRLEIKRKFDEIVDFSEVEKFLDTPVKRYSSGMYVRLAFAVAAHLEPEILIVDEVLAVGDAQFQKKCLGKMQDVSKGGRTVIFVSHNMNAVLSLCTSGLALQKGEVIYNGPVRGAVDMYSGGKELAGNIDLSGIISGSSLGRLLRLKVKGETDSPSFKPDERVKIAVQFELYEPLDNVRVSLGFTNSRGDRIFAIANYLGGENFNVGIGEGEVHCGFSVPPIAPGRYTMDLGFGDQQGGVIQEVYGAGTIEILETNYLGTTVNHFDQMGHVLVRSDWKLAQLL